MSYQPSKVKTSIFGTELWERKEPESQQPEMERKCQVLKYKETKSRDYLTCLVILCPLT